MLKNAIDAAPSAIEPLMTKAELAGHLQVTERTIENQEKKGLPRIYVGRLPRYHRAKVEAWLEARANAPPNRPRGRPRNVDRGRQT